MMFPGMDPRAMRQAMKKMGIAQDDVPAQAVIMILGDRKLVFDNPEVQKITMQGQESFQVSGTYREEPLGAEPERAPQDAADEESIETVMSQTGCSREDATAALERAGGDLAAAILDLSER